MTLLDAMDDPNLFGPWFKGGSWDAWRVFLKALFNLPMSDADRETFRACTGRQSPPANASEAWLAVGRRGGKSLIAALVAVFVATFRNYAALLAPGEVATVPIIAADRRQARVIQRYVIGFLEEVPMLAALVESKTRESVTLVNRVVIEIHTCSFRSIRGYTMAGAVCDEIAFWRSEEISANPDREILAALRPGLASIPGSLLLCLSSPYSRRGELFEAFRRFYGSDSPDVLVWKAPTLTMNPTIPPRVVESARERDPAAAESEWDAEFRRDLAAFIDLDTVRALAPAGRKTLPPKPGVAYRAFVDPAGGSGKDSMTLAVSHRERDGRAVLDLLLEKRPPFSPEAAVEEFAAALDPYRVDRVTGDRYAGDWPAEQFRKRGFEYEPCPKPKSEIYLDLLPALNSGRVELLDHPRLLGQLSNLERRTSRAGRDIVDHPPNSHDDLANAAAGALVMEGPRVIQIF